jgi:hypothetical protein
MGERPRINDSTSPQHVEQGLHSQTKDLVEGDLNSRLDELTVLVDQLDPDRHDIRLEHTVQICDRKQELRVKVEAVRWMIRIAKHLKGVGRKMVISTIGKSLEDLESAVAAEIRMKGGARAA